jgi:hypothetical protein
MLHRQGFDAPARLFAHDEPLTELIEGVSDGEMI